MVLNHPILFVKFIQYTVNILLAKCIQNQIKKKFQSVLNNIGILLMETTSSGFAIGLCGGLLILGLVGTEALRRVGE